MRLAGKRIILGVTGSIAAYKTAFLTRLFITEGAEVQIIMSESAKSFITPLTLSVLSKKPVLSEMTGQGHSWNNHIELGCWADLLIVAPMSANSMAAFASGICQNLLQAVFLSARCPVLLAPAMDHDMYLHPATQANLSLLKERGVMIADPEKGELASGIVGEGRMREPEILLEQVCAFFEADKPLAGKHILVTAGPTREKIDPVRYISNFSTGRMGVSVVRELLSKGAIVHLVSGPMEEEIPAGAIHIPAASAAEMYDACMRLFPSMNAAVMAAAVADYAPLSENTQKVKKSAKEWSLDLVKTKDILQAMGAVKTVSQVLIGFALETQNEFENAMEKLKRKNLDMIVLNSLQDEGAGFGTETNKVTMIYKNNTCEVLPLMSKDLVAKNIVLSLLNLMHA